MCLAAGQSASAETRVSARDTCRTLPAPAAGVRDPCLQHQQAQIDQLQTDVDAKANKSYVDQHLGSKAEESRVRTLEGSVSQELAKKVDQGAFATAQGEFKKLSDRVDDINRSKGFQVDRFWVLLAALLVFFMQAGFKALEVGMVEERLDTWQAGLKLFSWILTYVGYTFLGFGLMFAFYDTNFIGPFVGQWLWGPNDVVESADKALSAFNHIPNAKDNTIRGLEFFLFQAAFAATAVTIPAGSTVQRMQVGAYIVAALMIAAVIYPVFGHLAWAGSIYSDAYLADPSHAKEQGWLQARGFHDFAGSTVVHSVGGWCALMFTLALGAREGRFGADNTVNQKSFRSRSRGYAILGVFMLWFGWWGFNGGSKLVYDTDIAKIILNTNLAGAAAGLSSYFLAQLTEALPWRFFQTKRGMVPEKVIGGVLGGLVAITASCDQATPTQAFFVIGILAGIVHNVAYDVLLWRRIDDPVGAIPVHLACGILGTFLVAWTPYPESVQASVGHHIWIQLVGIVVAGIWTVSTAWVLCKLLRAVGLLQAHKAAPLTAGRPWMG